ncbi:MAG: hypothetical protein K1X88_06985 [Nannocystaceae bacterium]|nr:hypothetical protein [Nannocystaceae bacterium]
MAGRRIGATAVGLVFTWGSAAPSLASARVTDGVAWAAPALPAMMMLAKKKKKPAAEESAPGPSLTPEAAEAKRKEIRDGVAGAKESGDFAAVADGLQGSAEELGDPVTMLEAGEARLEQAKKDRDADAAQAAIETTRVALDMLHFYAAVDAGAASSDWLVIAPADAGGLIEQADAQIEAAEALIKEIEAEKTQAAGGTVAAADDKKKKRKRKKRAKGDGPAEGTGFIAAGSIFTVIGIGGAGMGVGGLAVSSSKQKEVEKHMMGDPEVADLDKAGKRANILGYAGLGVAVVGLAVGLPLIIVGAKKRKAGKSTPSAAARASERAWSIAPSFGRGGTGLVVQGRF